MKVYTFKFTALLVLFGLSLVSSAFAIATTPEKRAEKMLPEFVKVLALDEEQTEAVRQALITRETALDEAKTEENYEAAAEEIGFAFDAELEEILSEEQMQTYREHFNRPEPEYEDFEDDSEGDDSDGE